MKITTKEYTIIKTKNYIKKNKLFFFFNGINRNSNDLVLVEQNLQKINLNCYKIYNKTSKKALNSSIYLKVSALINGITFFIKPIANINEAPKRKLITDLELLNYTLLAFSLNNKIYSKTQLKSVLALNYIESKLLFFQFSITHLKTVCTKTKTL